MAEALRIVILEDQPADAELVAHELRKAGFEFVAKNVTTEREFLAELRDSAPHLILADYSLPGYDGLSALAAAQEQCPETPFIFVSGSLGEEKAIETLHRGATDYVLKQRLARLGPAVRRALREREEMRKGQQAEQRIRELNLVLRATGAINSLMVRERDPKRLLAEACNILVEMRGYQLAWIGRVEPGSKRVVPAASAGRDAGYLDAASIMWDESPTGQGPIGTAIRTGQPMACQDTATDPRFAPWKAAAIARGFASVAALPMIHASRVLGAVAVYSGRTGAFNAEELDLLKELAADLAFALQSIEHEQQRSRVEESLGESERRYRLLFNSGYDAVFVHQPGKGGNGPGKFIEVNDIACHRLGYTRAELLQMTPRDISAPETLPDIPGIRAKLAVEKTAVSEGVHITKDGRRIPVEISTHVFELNGKPTRLSAVRDITERKQLEQALRESSQFNEQIVASAQEGIIVYGRDLKYQVWNPFMEQLTGMPAGQVLGKHPDELFPFLRETAVLASVQKGLAGEPTSLSDFHFEVPSSGKSGWVSQTNGSLRNAAGEIIGVIGIVRDVTERKRAELRIAAFANLGQRLNAAKTPKAAGEIIVGVADELLGWDACVFDLYSAAENRISHVLNMDLVDGRRTECSQRYVSSSPRELSKRAIEQGGQLILRDPPNAVRPEGSPFGDMSRPSASLMFVPVRHGTEVVGVLSLQSYTRRAYDAQSLEALQALADYGGGALERLRAQDALSESEASFRSVWERSIDGMRLIDKEGRIIAVNDAFCQLVKLPRERLEGQIFSVAYKGHGPSDGIEVYQKRFTTGDIVPHDARRVQLWNSEVVDLEISNSFIELGQRGRMLLSIFRDISDRKRAEEALQRERHTAQRYLDVAGVMIVAIDPSQNVLLANRKTCETLACEEGDLIGRNWFDFATPEKERDPLKAGFGEMMAGNIAPWEYVEGPVLTRRGAERLIAWHNTLLRDETGRVIATLSSGEDITERKGLEAQLRQSQKMEAVGQLAGGVAHDFNNMLAVIRGNAELLLMEEDQHTPETRQGLKHVVEASERAANLTRQMLTFSRKQILRPQPLVLNEVIANLTKMLNRVLSENIDLQCHYAAPLPYVQADTGMMEQVILNLVVNARDAMPEGGHLRVATGQLTLDEAHARLNSNARAGDFVCLSVSDTGTGIAPENLTHIFEPFFTTKEPGKGTGLGLATVYGIVQQHQGWIEVSSQVGEGTTFKVFLPAIPTPAGLAAPAEVGADILGGKETILLVEDEHSVRLATRRVLERKGYTIREATSAREALELWHSHDREIALLLTDIVMPGEMSGRDLAEQLWAQRPGLKVIFMSGYSAEVLGKGTDFIRRNRSHFLQKPSSSRTILETVRRSLDQKEPGTASGEAGRAK